MVLLLAALGRAHGAERADEDGKRERLERRAERRVDRTEVAEIRWKEAVDAVTPADPRSLKEADRAEQGLISTRARASEVARRLDAWDAPPAEVHLLYATNRRRGTGGHRDEQVAYRARDADRVEYGVVTIEIPARHPVGELDRGLRIVHIEPLTTEQFSIALFQQLQDAGPRAEVLTWIHGYNNSFDYAARRLGQVSHDLDRPVVPVLFAWPSHGDTWLALFKYTYDENAAARSSSALADTLDELLASTQGAPVHLVAHSMGSRVLSDAVLDLQYQHRQERRFDEIVLAAPDVDAAVFERRYLHPLSEASHRISVYCAADDRALQLSRSVHGGYDRLGSCRDQAIGWLDDAGVEVIDASRLYVDVLEHDKLADSPRLLGDLGLLLDGVPAAAPARGLEQREHLYVLPP